jgi:SAM-dependent methyltransferase
MVSRFMLNNTKDFWKESWDRHLPSYLEMPPRQGMYLELLFPNRSFSFLELGAGSARDARYLAAKGRRVIASDYTPELAANVQLAGTDPRFEFRVLDAFATGLPAKAYDVSYHNGLWIYFEDDQDLNKLAREQARITRRYLVVTVHSAHNEGLKASFASRVAEDPLYDIRFFTRDELFHLLRPFGPTRIFPFGGPLDGQLIGGWRLGRLPFGMRSLVYRHICPRTSPSEWERITAVTAVG